MERNPCLQPKWHTFNLLLLLLRLPVATNKPIIIKLGGEFINCKSKLEVMAPLGCT